MSITNIGVFMKEVREKNHMTQQCLAEKISVSDKTISKWETGRGYPDISLLEPIAKALNLSVSELLSGENVINNNRSFNMKKIKMYVCPICGNVITSMGECKTSCCGLDLHPLDNEESDDKHKLNIEKCEDEYYVNLSHPMSKEHYISFIAGIYDNGIELVKLYPEGPAEARFKISRCREIYYYCNHHGLFHTKIG